MGCQRHDRDQSANKTQGGLMVLTLKPRLLGFVGHPDTLKKTQVFLVCFDFFQTSNSLSVSSNTLRPCLQDIREMAPIHSCRNVLDLFWLQEFRFC